MPFIMHARRRHLYGVIGIVWDGMSQIKIIIYVLSAFIGVGVIATSHVVASDGSFTN